MATRSKSEHWKIRVYIRRSVPDHLELLSRLQAVCKEGGLGRNSIEVVDVENDLGEVEREAILALPLTVRVSPLPMRRIIGNPNLPEQLRESLGLQARVS